MKYSVFNKLYDVPHGHLEADDLSPAEKKQLYDMLATYGMTPSTAYLRLFYKGFDLWEIQGIDHIRNEFCENNNLQDIARKGEGFYSALTPYKGMKLQLTNLMTALGMEHRNTINHRFDADDWKPWERKGIRQLIANFYNISKD